ncbi:V-type ATPase subunit [Candidatus Woesearchaeota archaeon]|nr:V-type ATPase subunit [Candidatus Woesearchaeota archaeon]
MGQFEQEVFSMGDMPKRRIRLGEYPYTFVRVIVMRTALFKQHDYDKLLKMSLPEISRFMQDSSYREEITSLGSRFHGVDLIERSITLSLEKTFSKLRAISSPELRILIDLYLGRYDYSNCKTILRAIFSVIPKEIIKESLFFVGALGQHDFEDMLNSTSVAEAIDTIPFLEKKERKLLASSFDRSKNLISVENFLDRRYYAGVLHVLPLLSRAGALFREFLMEEIYILDFLTAVKLKSLGIPSLDIEKYFIAGKPASLRGKQFGEKIKRVLNASSLTPEELFKILKNSPFGDVTKNASSSVISLGQAEINLYSILLKKTLILQHQHPLSVDVILGFMFAKEIEGRNIRTIAKGKHLGLTEEQLAQLIVR